MKFKIVFLLWLLVASAQSLYAQCAMCKATLENNVEETASSLSKSLNVGIMYLLATPYLLVGVVALLWYRASKKAA